MENGDLRLELPLSQSKRFKGNLTWILLHFTLDCFFGKGTESALCNFQKARGISINMIAGKATISKLFEDKFTVILSVKKIHHAKMPILLNCVWAFLLE